LPGIAATLLRQGYASAFDCPQRPQQASFSRGCPDESIGGKKARKEGNMTLVTGALRIAAAATIALIATVASAADYPTPKEADWVAKDFKFHDGQVLSEVRLHYTTIGEPTGEPVLVLHGTGGSGASMLNPAFAGELFGPGQPLDATKYFIILPDALGAGKSSKPSDGMRTQFPLYNYDDMVAGQYRLVTEGLGLKHLRLVIGNSMGGMQTWVWGVTHPDFMDALVPMACQPTEMSGRNWMLRRMLTESIRRDPDWKDGNYTTQPKMIAYANAFYGLATSGGDQAWYKAAPNREKADRIVEERLAGPFKPDANDFLYQWDSSRDYNPSPGLEKIVAPVLAINAADDERNPPELGIMERELKRVKNAKLYLIPASEETRGHGTTGLAKFWKKELEAFLQSVPTRTQ
jgi:homoserine O-acetyltransferase